MTTGFKMVTGSVLLAGMVALSACSLGGGTDSATAGKPTAPPASPVEPAAPASSSDAAASASSGQASQAPAAGASPGQTASPPSQSAAPAAQDKPAPSGQPQTAPSAPAASAADTSGTAKRLQQLMELAKSGKVPDIAFAAHTNLIDDVEKSWGAADKKDSAGSGIYAVYSKKHAVIGFNKGSQIFDVRTNDPKWQTLTLQQIQQTLGQPQDTKVNGEDTIYIYKTGNQFQLKFIIPKSTGKVDHISVFFPQDSVNNMAG